MLDFLDPVGKIALPVAVISAALLWPKTEPATFVIELTDLPAPIITIEAPSPGPAPVIEFPEIKPPVINVSPSAPVVTEKLIEVPGPTVYEDREVEVEKIIEVPSCLDYSDLPYFDLASAVSVTRPGEGWSLSGDFYNGLNWLADTPKPTFNEILGGWLTNLEEDC